VVEAFSYINQHFPSLAGLDYIRQLFMFNLSRQVCLVSIWN